MGCIDHSVAYVACWAANWFGMGRNYNIIWIRCQWTLLDQHLAWTGLPRTLKCIWIAVTTKSKITGVKSERIVCLSWIISALKCLSKTGIRVKL